VQECTAKSARNVFVFVALVMGQQKIKFGNISVVKSPDVGFEAEKAMYF
jgi:hypothetical protein